MQVLPDLSLILIYSLDHCKLVEDIIDVEQGGSRRSEGIEKPVVGLPKVVSKSFIALVDVARLQMISVRSVHQNFFPFHGGLGLDLWGFI